jgi:hypothetical protein
MKKIFFYFVLLVLTGCKWEEPVMKTLLGQAGSSSSKIWDKTFGGSKIEFPRSIISTNDGGFVIVGESDSNISGDKSENHKGAVRNYWIVKINSNGQKIWDKTIGGGFEQYPKVVATIDGGFVIAGSSTADIAGDKSENSKGNSDYWIVKINSTGQKVWDKTIGGSGEDQARSIIATNDGSFIVVGQSDSNISGDKSENSKSNGIDYWIVKINSTGQKVWDKTLGGSNADQANSIITTNDGGMIVAGWSASNISGDKSENSKGSGDYWVVKLNGNGQKIWDKTIGSSGADFLSAIITTTDGGFLISGTSEVNISGDKTENSKGLRDYWVVKLSGNGQKIWDKTFGGNVDDNANNIIATNDGGFVIAGQSESNISGDKSENSKGEADYWILKINSSGQKVWDKTFGGSDADVNPTIVAIPDGNFVMAGYSKSNISGDKSENSRGESDFWIIKVK